MLLANNKNLYSAMVGMKSFCESTIHSYTYIRQLNETIVATNTQNIACCETFILIRCLPPIQNLLENQLATNMEKEHMVFSSTLQTEIQMDITAFTELHTPLDTSTGRKKPTVSLDRINC